MSTATQHVFIDLAIQGGEPYQSYSAVSIKSSILELTSSKMRFSAVFLLLRNSSDARRTTCPLVEFEDRAVTSNCSNSPHAISKCSRLVKIWTI